MATAIKGIINELAYIKDALGKYKFRLCILAVWSKKYDECSELVFRDVAILSKDGKRLIRAFRNNASDDKKRLFEAEMIYAEIKKDVRLNNFYAKKIMNRKTG